MSIIISLYKLRMIQISKLSQTKQNFMVLKKARLEKGVMLAKTPRWNHNVIMPLC